eukprot:1114659-Amphidinium_carterae.1
MAGADAITVYSAASIRKERTPLHGKGCHPMRARARVCNVVKKVERACQQTSLHLHFRKQDKTPAFRSDGTLGARLRSSTK